MNADLLLVLGALIACVGLFIINKPRMDVVALLVIVILPLTGIISMPEALAGFSDTNVVLIAALFVIGEGLTRTGIAYQVSDHLIGMSGTSEARLVVLLMLAVAGLGSVMSSTGVVAIFVPVALNVAERMGVRPRRLMMALAYAGLISGMLTLVGTAPNMVVDGAVREHGFQGFNFFSFTPFGMAMLVLRRSLHADRPPVAGCWRRRKTTWEPPAQPPRAHSRLSALGAGIPAAAAA